MESRAASAAGVQLAGLQWPRTRRIHVELNEYYMFIHDYACEPIYPNHPLTFELVQEAGEGCYYRFENQKANAD